PVDGGRPARKGRRTGGRPCDRLPAEHEGPEQKRREEHRHRAQEHRPADLRVHARRGPFVPHDSTSSWPSQSLPRAIASGLPSSCGPRRTVGMTSKLWCGGGDGSVHSSVPTCHGLAGAGLPRRRLEKKFQTNTSCAAPSTYAAREIQTFHGSRCFRKSYTDGS